MSGTIARYSLVAIGLHWLTVLALPVQAWMGDFMTGLPRGVEQFTWYARHKSVGMILLALFLIRLVWRVLNRPPASPLPAWEQMAARVVHASLYALLVAVPVSGWLMSSASNAPVSIFGVVTVPDLVAPDPNLRRTFLAAHRVLFTALVLLAGLHVIAAAGHLIRRDGIVRRMLPLPGGRP
jgi:cytochrome b561